MYSQQLTLSEFSEVMKHQEGKEQEFVWPSLSWFAFNSRNAEMFQEATNQYYSYVHSCDCWHCTIMSKRPFVTGHDLYLRYVLLASYGNMAVMLN